MVSSIIILHLSINIFTYDQWNYFDAVENNPTFEENYWVGDEYCWDWNDHEEKSSTLGILFLFLFIFRFF